MLGSASLESMSAGGSDLYKTINIYLTAELQQQVIA